MKNYIACITMGFVFLLVSCSREESGEFLSSVGYWEVTEGRLSCHEEVLSLTRAVDACLQLQLLQGNQVVREFPPESPALSKRMTLSPGVYTLKAFTPLQGEAPDNEPGYPEGELMREFTVVAGDLTTLSLIVPQKNVGVRLKVSKEIQTYFSTCMLEVSSVSGRKVTVASTALISPYYYFDLPADGKLTYKLNLTNTDGEVYTVGPKHITNMVSPRNYTIQLEVAEGTVRSSIHERH